MSTIQPYNRFDPAKNFDSIDFLPDRWHQSAEMNELQSMFAHRLRGMSDALFTEGAIVRDARCTVNPDTGAATLESGALYIQGAVRGVEPATLTVPTTGTVHIGVYALSQKITELEDPSLRNPAVGTLGYQQPGAWRTRLCLTWGVHGDGTPGAFTPVWEIIDGLVRQRQAAPQLGAITQAIARYDRDSSGGTYVVHGFEVTAMDDAADGAQVYNVALGAARINGRAVDIPMARRVEVDTSADTATVDAEPKVSAGEASQPIRFDRFPVVTDTVAVRIIRRRTVTVVHGGFVGAADPLPDNAALVIENVSQGGTTYTPDTDYLFVANQIDWSPGGAEPAPGSSYQVTYQHKTLATPDNLTPYGFDITGAIAGTLIESTYQHKLRRIDSLVMTEDGDLRMVRGMPDTWSPRAPALPANMLALANIHQRWDEGRRVESSAVRVVPMSTLVGYHRRLGELARQMAELRLAVFVAGRYSGIKHGQFADPMMDDSMRDAGIEQTAIIAENWLQLPAGVNATPLAPLSEPASMAHTHAVVLKQAARTGALAVNPTAQPGPHRPTTLKLTPAADLWHAGTVYFRTPWLTFKESDQFRAGELALEDKGIEAARQQLTVSKSGEPEPTMRPIRITMAASGLLPGEAVASVSIAGITVPFAAPAGGSTTAAANGTVTVLATVPAGVPYGTVAVTLTGASGSVATALYRGAITYEAVGSVAFKTHYNDSNTAFAHVRVRFEL